MVRCGSTYRVFINGEWRAGLTYEEAQRLEAEQLYAVVQRKRAAGETVILTTDMWRQAEQARSAAI